LSVSYVFTEQTSASASFLFTNQSMSYPLAVTSAKDDLVSARSELMLSVWVWREIILSMLSHSLFSSDF